MEIFIFLHSGGKLFQSYETF